MSSHVAASAFGHCLMLVRGEAVATDLAVVAVRRGGRALGAVLGHARAQALAFVAEHPPPPVDIPPHAGAPDVALALAATRPALELAVVDLSGRYGLSRSGLGIALRMTPSSAAAKVAEVAQAWEAELDPALLAWLGPGECEELTRLLTAAPSGDAAQLLTLGAEVSSHIGSCSACSDRRRAMPSVRQLVTGTPLHPPPVTVIAAASGSRLQPPVPPPPLEPRRHRVPVRAVAAAAAVVAGAGVVAAVAEARRDDRRTSALAALTRLPIDASALQLVPSTIDVATRQVSLTNTSGVTVGWELATDAPWLEAVPASGRLGPGETTVLRLDGSPPEGEVRAWVRVTGEDGSASAAALAGTVEHPPDLGADAEACVVRATVEDEGEVVVVLHWRDGAGVERTTGMAESDPGLQAALPPGVAPITWWVSAVDGRGNQARTPDRVLPGGC